MISEAMDVMGEAAENPLSSPAKTALLITGIAAVGLGAWFVASKASAAMAKAPSYAPASTLTPGSTYMVAVAMPTPPAAGTTAAMVTAAMQAPGSGWSNPATLFLSSDPSVSTWPSVMPKPADTSRMLVYQGTWTGPSTAVPSQQMMALLKTA